LAGQRLKVLRRAVAGLKTHSRGISFYDLILFVILAKTFLFVTLWFRMIQSAMPEHHPRERERASLLPK
jgi:hypothetical protein